jgi:predicted extracellular nuclease
MHRFLCCLLLMPVFVTYGQKQLHIAFYNQENLFDTIDDPRKNDNEFLPSSKKEWNTEKYTNKLNHMAKVIASLNDGKGPDVLGMCEVENDLVLADLVRNEQLLIHGYGIVHFESPDERGIDNALLYRKSSMKPLQAIVYPINFPDKPDSKTRDILVVKMEMKNGQKLIFIVNHFPSRTGGQEESEPRRFYVASVLRKLCDSISAADPAQQYLLMGDFNDEPTDPSIDSVLMAKATAAEATRPSDLFNAMHILKTNGEGTLQYRKEWNMLDQFMMNKPLLDCAKKKFCYRPGSAHVFKPEWMQSTEDKFKGTPLRTFGGNKYLNGYSDHFPVYLYLDLK